MVFVGADVSGALASDTSGFDGIGSASDDRADLVFAAVFFAAFGFVAMVPSF